MSYRSTNLFAIVAKNGAINDDNSNRIQRAILSVYL